MAAKISTDVTVFFVNFATGNEAGDFDDYANYAIDMDSDFVDIRDKFNVLVDEVNALGGSGALINFDLILIGDSATPGGVRVEGLIGEHSYACSIDGGDNTLINVEAGQAVIIGNQRVVSLSQVQLDGDAGASVGVNFIAIDSNGAPSIQTSAAQKSLDVASADWSGSQWNSVTRFENSGSPTSGDDFLATPLPDGDAHREFLFRPNIGTSWQDKTHLRPDERVEAIERILAGLTTDTDGDTLGPLALDAEWLAAGTVDLERGGTNKDFSGEADGSFIVGTGGGLVLESGATARTSMGVGTADTPQFAKIGLGAAASASADTLAYLERAGDIVMEFNNTGGSQFEIAVGASTILGTTDATDLRLFRAGVAAANERLACLAAGVDLFDDAGNVALRASGVGGTQAVQLGMSGGKVGFYATTPIALPTVSGAREGGGSLVWLSFSRVGTFSAGDVELGNGNVIPVGGMGPICVRPGSLTALTVTIQVTETTPGQIDTHALIDDSEIATASFVTSSSGIYQAVFTQAKGVDAVSAGSNIRCVIDAFSGAFVGSVDKAFAVIEINHNDTVPAVTNLLTQLGNQGLVNDTTTAT